MIYNRSCEKSEREPNYSHRAPVVDTVARPAACGGVATTTAHVVAGVAANAVRDAGRASGSARLRLEGQRVNARRSRRRARTAPTCSSSARRTTTRGRTCWRPSCCAAPTSDYALGVDAKERRPVALSLEMFERDVQTVLDEYLAGLISERHFLLSSRPWKNYETDYRPLVEYARAQQTARHRRERARALRLARLAAGPGVARGALRRRRGVWLPPLPFAPASDAYAAKFNRFMGGEAARPRDAARARGRATRPRRRRRTAAPAPARRAEPARRLDGLRHRRTPQARPRRARPPRQRHLPQRGAMGVPEQLARYRPKARAVVVTIVPAEGFPDFDAASIGAPRRLHHPDATRTAALRRQSVRALARPRLRACHNTPLAWHNNRSIRDREAGVARFIDRV